MRRIGDLFKEMGFNKDASMDVQKAFFRHLVKHAGNPSISTPISETKPATTEAQLSFDPEILGVRPTEPGNRKIKAR